MKTIELLPKAYSYPVHQDLKALDLNTTCLFEKIKSIYIKKDTKIQLVCMGTSGILIATKLKEKLDKKYEFVRICLIRKDNDDCHHGTGDIDNSYYISIIVDDQVSSGRTIENIKDKLKYPNNVEIISAKWSNILEDRLKKMFPKCKYLMY